MSGVEALAIISVLAPALKISVDYVREIRKRRKKKKDENAFYEHELERSLGEGELEIRNTFHHYVFQLGDLFRRGDDISSQRIQTQITEAHSIQRVLKLARDHKRDIDDIRTRWRSAESIPRETIRTMDELCLRIMQGNMSPSVGLPSPPEPRRYDTGTSHTLSTNPLTRFEPHRHDSGTSSRLSVGHPAPYEARRHDSGSSSNPSIGLPVPPEPRRHDSGSSGAPSMSFPVPSEPHRRDTGSSNTQHTPAESRRYDTSSSNPQQVAPEPRRYDTSSSNPQQVAPDPRRYDTSSSHPQQVAPEPRRYDTGSSNTQQTPPEPRRHDTGSSNTQQAPPEQRRFDTAASNTLSAHQDPHRYSLGNSNLSSAPAEPRRLDTGTSNLFPMGFAAPHEPSRHETDTSTFLSATLVQSPVDSSANATHPFNISPSPLTSPPTRGSFHGEGLALPMRHAPGQEQQRNLGVSSPHRDSFSSLNTTNTNNTRGSRRSSAGPSSPPAHPPGIHHVSTGFISSAGREKIVGRPEKKNNFHGFCEGAWKTISDPKKGMPSVTLPLGRFGTTVVLQCSGSKCRFRANPHPLPGKKGMSMDPGVRTANCGIHYRFSFLAKSHQRCDETRGYAVHENVDQKMSSQSYGCLFCNAEGWTTANFGGVESLMNHIHIEHSRHETPGIERLTNCIWGREASQQESFDINVPYVVSPAPDPTAPPPFFDLDAQAEQDLMSFRPLEPGRSSVGPTQSYGVNHMHTWTLAELAGGGDQSPIELPADESYSLPRTQQSVPAELEDYFLQRVTH